MAQAAKADEGGAKKTPKAKRRRAPRSTVVGRWIAVGALVLFALLYYRPLKAYLDAHRELAQKQTQVQLLKAERARLTHRLGASTSLGTLAREARALGYVKPGERLFIVKGINEWRARERASYAHK
jgi:cell division protein FtsB